MLAAKPCRLSVRGEVYMAVVEEHQDLHVDGLVVARTPLRLAAERLRHDYVALGSVLFIALLVLFALAGTVFESWTGHPLNRSNASGVDDYTLLPVGPMVGCPDGWEEGCSEGCPVGCPEGCVEGSPVGCPEGCPVGCPEGCVEGWPVGCPEGCPVGCPVGCLEGSPVGCPVGCVEGWPVGCLEG
jgi:hypothetical protein